MTEQQPPLTDDSPEGTTSVEPEHQPDGEPASDTPDEVAPPATPAQLETADAIESTAALEGAPEAADTTAVEATDVEGATAENDTTDTSTVEAVEVDTTVESTGAPVDADVAVNPSDPGADSDSDSTEAPDPSKATEPTAPAEPTESSDTSESTEPTEPSDTSESSEPSQASPPSPPSTPSPSASPASASAPKPSALPRRPVPTPAPPARPGASPSTGPVAPPTITTDHSASAAHGRVDDEGVVYVLITEGEERQVGSYPGASPEQALTYFARKYDELFVSAGLLEARVQQPDVASKDVQDALKTLTAQTTDAAVVGDLAALAAKLEAIRSGIAAKRAVEQQHRAAARAQAKQEREAIVTEAESIAAQPESRVQWKTSGARMRELLDSWKGHQRAGVRLDRESESALWQRFSAARNRFDKARRTHFAGLDAAHADAKSAKQSLVAQAETLAVSKDWAPTAGAFKRLMDEWRSAGRASRSDDDQLWARFKTAQDAFFTAKDAVVAAEEEGFRGNLSVKQALLKEAEAILPVTDIEKAKGQLRAVQDRWDAAGKVPRGDLERIEKAMRRIEQTIRDADEKRWASSNPEAAARATAMAEQLERAVKSLEEDLAAAQASQNSAKIAKAQGALDARRAWLAQARAGMAEFGA